MYKMQIVILTILLQTVLTLTEPILHALIDEQPIPGNVLYTRGTVHVTCAAPSTTHQLHWYILSENSSSTLFSKGPILRTQQRYTESRTYVCMDSTHKEWGNVSITAISTSYRGEVLKNPEQLQVEFIEEPTLKCKLKNERVDYELIWKKNGEAVECDGKYNCLIDEEGALTLLAPEEAGVYACHFQDQQEIDRAVEYFEVATSPIMEEDLPGVNRVEGDDVELNCYANGYPIPIATWFKDGQPIDIYGDRINTSRSTEGIKDGRLRITNLSFDDRAKYTCETSNPYGTAKSHTTVRVKDSLAALWPAIGIAAEVIILFIIIFIHEKRRNKREMEEERKEQMDFERLKRMNSPPLEVQTLLLQEEGTTNPSVVKTNNSTKSSTAV